jgi:hypothetical protein
MQSTAQPVPSSASFAGFLAALSQGDRAGTDRVSDQSTAKAQPWNEELLAADVATLSYEKALRTHARYHAADPIEDSGHDGPNASADPAASQPQAPPSGDIAAGKVLKEASITIRLSREEDAQLRRRAAEAGLTVSAYIRSCTFEAESLRALVKDTLTQFRAGHEAPQPEKPDRRRWLAFFRPGRRAVHSPGPKQA